MRIQDLPRYLGQHSGGMVIYHVELNQIVPLERASMPGRTVVQWDKEDYADLGIMGGVTRRFCCAVHRNRQN